MRAYRNASCSVSPASLRYESKIDYYLIEYFVEQSIVRGILDQNQLSEVVCRYYGNCCNFAFSSTL